MVCFFLQEFHYFFLLHDSTYKKLPLLMRHLKVGQGSGLELGDCAADSIRKKSGPICH